MGINTHFFVCPSCESEQLEKVESYLTCANCEMKYPVIDGQIPVLVTNSAQLITQTYQQYVRFSESQKNENLQLKNSKNPYRDPAKTDQLISAKEHNASILSSLKELLRPFVDPDQLTNGQSVNDFRYLINWEYLRRDWSYENTGEYELSTILNHVTQEIPEEQQKGNVVILGAGAGRLVNELSEYHSSVFALDNMFTMVGLYHQVLKNDVRFYEINEKNLLKTSDRVIEKVAKRANVASNVSPENYFWGDASKLPFAKQSLSRVYSIYFTDVLPLTTLLDQVKNVLHEGGDFVHFGPLFYHFSQVDAMLSAEEVAAAFEQNGFDIIVNTTAELSHHKSDISMMYRMYNNWCFIARKRAEKAVKIDENTQYEVDQGLTYIAEGEISSTTRELDFNLKMTLPDGTKYASTDVILEAVKRADGVRTFGEILREIETEYGQELPKESREELKEIFALLVDKKVIKIVD